MTRVDFYLLEDRTLLAAARFACRLAAKALDGAHQVHVHTRDEAAAAEFDALLWTYPPHRFIPHDLAGDSARHTGREAITIGHGDAPVGDDVLINLGTQVPDFFGRYERVAEIIVEDIRAEGRERYRYYRDCGYPLYHHDLANWEES
ncbi:MAG: DNA polymerase III subunit chi [Pseudomonadota bacterium]